MVIAVALMLVMQVAIDQIIDVIAMRDGRVSTVRTMDVVCGMTAAGVATRAIVRMGGVDIERMLFNHSLRCLMVQMAIVQIVHMIAMLNGGMAALSTVNVFVIFVIMSHDNGSLEGKRTTDRKE
jgi:hypothetical protein